MTFSLLLKLRVSLASRCKWHGRPTRFFSRQTIFSTKMRMLIMPLKVIVHGCAWVVDTLKHLITSVCRFLSYDVLPSNYHWWQQKMVATGAPSVRGFQSFWDLWKHKIRRAMVVDQHRSANRYTRGFFR